MLNVGMMTIWAENARNAVARKKEMGKTKEELYGRGEGGHAGGRSEGG